MKKPAFVALAGIALIGATALVSAQDEKKADKPSDKPAAKPSGKLTDQKTKASYAIGLEYGSSIKRSVQELELDVDALLMGFRASLTGDEPELSKAEIAEAMQAFQRQVMVARQKKAQEAAPPEVRAEADKASKEGAAFLTANKSKPGVVTTKSGLQYKVVKEGKGASPKPADSVKVHYRGTYIDGKEFDSSYKRGEPITFEVGGVIAGWTEALQLMKVGSKYQLFIPSDLAYGFQGKGDIGPNQTLVFEVELLGIE